jgi:Kef-type K+ transport system membrane component KefB
VEFSNERGVNMGFTSILALIVIAILIIVINVVIQGMKNKNWKQVIIAVTAFTVFIVVLGYGLICFITSM